MAINLYDLDVLGPIKSVLRITVLLAAIGICAWTVLQYFDARAFNERNAASVALCGLLMPGMSTFEVERRVHQIAGAAIHQLNGNLIVKIPHQSACLVETADGSVRKSSVLRNG